MSFFAAKITLPSNQEKVTVSAGETVVTQCQSMCGNLRWLMNGNMLLNGQDNTQLVYLANCNSRDACVDRNFIVCDAEQSLIDMGPLTSNLTLKIGTPGKYYVQCQGTLHGNQYRSLGNFEYYSQVILITVTAPAAEGTGE